MNNKEPKYSHRVTALFQSGQGVFEILNDTKVYQTRTQINELTDNIVKKNNLKSATISNILTVLNK